MWYRLGDRLVDRYLEWNILRVPISPRTDVDALYAPRRYLLDRLLVDAAEDAAEAMERMYHKAS